MVHSPNLVWAAAVTASCALAGTSMALAPPTAARDAYRSRTGPGVRVWVMRGGSPVSPSARFFGGERFSLHVETNEPLYLYAVHVGSPAAEGVVFPCSPVGYTQAVERGRPVTMPCSGVLVFDRQPGVEKILLAWSRRPMTVLSELVDLTGRLAFRVGAQRLDDPPARWPTAGPRSLTPQDRSRLQALRKQAAGLLATALARPDVLVTDQPGDHGSASPVGLYAVAERLRETDVACVALELAHLTPEIRTPEIRKTPLGVTAKDIFLNTSNVATPGPVPAGSGVRCTVLAGGTRPVTTNHAFRSGDGFSLRLETNADLYCRVYGYAPDGRPLQLYPMPAGEDLLVQGGQTVAVPTPPSQFRFDGVPGLERLTLVFSRRKLGVLVRPVPAVAVLSRAGQALYGQMYVRTAGLRRLRQQTQSRAKDIHYVADPKPGPTTGLYVVDTSPQPAQPILVDVVLIHR